MNISLTHFILRLYGVGQLDRKPEVIVGTVNWTVNDFFYLMTHSTHFIYSCLASIHTVMDYSAREETYYRQHMVTVLD